MGRECGFPLKGVFKIMSMYAMIESGGKQYRVRTGDTIKLELLPAEAGSDVEFDKVLMLVDDAGKVQLGKPLLDKVRVRATVLEHGRHKKVNIIKFRRRKHSMKRMGHRQHYTQVQITEIV